MPRVPRFERIVELAQQLNRAASSADRILITVSTFVVDELQFDRCVIALRHRSHDPNAFLVRVSNGIGESSASMVLSINEDLGKRLGLAEHVALPLDRDEGAIVGLLIAGNGKIRGAFDDTTSQSLQMIAAMTSLALRSADLQQLADEVHEAKSFQQSLLPQLPISPDMRFAALYRAAGIVGGDIYDVFSMGPRHHRVFLADAIGHGVQASLRTMLIKGEYERVKMSGRTPHVALWMLNERILAAYSELSMHFSACCFDIVLDDRGRVHLDYANAGQTPLLHVRSGQAKEIYHPGPLIGLVSAIEIETEKYPLERGDRIFAFTDGAYDEWNPDGDSFGLERVTRILSRPTSNLDDLGAQLLGELDSFLGGAPLTDDLALIGVEITAA